MRAGRPALARRAGHLPYHAWAYGLDGRLVSTGFATPTPDFDPADHGLLPVATRVWKGGIYLCLADVPPGFAPDPAGDVLANWPLDRLVTGHRRDVTLACNWKVFWENYNECLHCPGVHPELSARVPIYRRGVMSPEELPEGVPSGPSLADGARTWTVSGAPCGPEFPDLTEAERTAGHTFVTVYPAMFLVAHVDFVRTVRLTPLGPETTRLTAEWLFAPEAMTAPGFDLSQAVDFAARVLAEDGAACEMNQRGLREGGITAARLMPQEFDIKAFHDWVRERMNAAGEG